MDTEEEGPERVRVDTTRASSGPFWRPYLRAIGPGLVTGASDDDPSTIAAYASAGGRYGFGLLWACLLAFPLMIAVEVLSDRTALATGKSLGELARDRFHGPWRRVLGGLLLGLLVANVIVIAADLAAVGEGISLIGAGPDWLWALVAGAVVLALVLSGSFATIAKAFKVLCLALLGYVAVLFVVDVQWSEVLIRTVLPRIRFEPGYLSLLVAVLGSTMPPYVFFWQNVHRIEELRDDPEGGERVVTLRERPPWRARQKERTSLLDVAAGMAFAVIVMFSVMVSTAATVGQHGPTTINSAAEAAKALKPAAGSLAQTLFSLGFISAGMLAIPVLAGSGSAGIAGLLGEEWGFSRSVRQAPLFYGLVATGTVGGALLTLIGVAPFKLLVVAAFVNGLAAAPLLLIVLLIASDRKLMGRFRPGLLPRTLAWVAWVVLAIAAVVTVVTAFL